jgi:hypothetical protein
MKTEKDGTLLQRRLNLAIEDTYRLKRINTLKKGQNKQIKDTFNSEKKGQTED